jgi:hypothetical protein
MTADFQEFLDVYRRGSFDIPDVQRAEEAQRLVPGLLPILFRCLEFSRSRRFADALQVQEALLAAMGRSSQRPTPVTLEMNVRLPAPATLEMNVHVPAPATLEMNVPAPARTLEMAATEGPRRRENWSGRSVAIVVVGFLVVAAATTFGVIWVLR